MHAIHRLLSVALVLLCVGTGTVAASDTALVTEEFMVPAADPGIDLYVRMQLFEAVQQFLDEKLAPGR